MGGDAFDATAQRGNDGQGLTGKEQGMNQSVGGPSQACLPSQTNQWAAVASLQKVGKSHAETCACSCRLVQKPTHLWMWTLSVLR